MKFNSPLPQPLPKECDKAAKIFASFIDNGNNGLDGIIPRPVLQQARGFALFSVVKAGFIFSARAGSGVVIARLDDGRWSAPSAIGIGGMGVGGQLGAEVTDFLIVLNSRSAVTSFMASGSVTLGGNMSVAIGPLGRNGEAAGSLNTSGRIAAMYSYSKTKGLFGGVSIEGSVIMERQDANALAYTPDVTVKKLLSGNIPPPEWASPLIRTLESLTGVPGVRKWIDDQPADRAGIYAFESNPGTPKSRPMSERVPSFLKRRKFPGTSPPDTWTGQEPNGSYFGSVEVGPTNTAGPASIFQNQFTSEDAFSSSPTRRLSLRPQSPPNPLIPVNSPADNLGGGRPYVSSSLTTSFPPQPSSQGGFDSTQSSFPIVNLNPMHRRSYSGHYIAPKAGLSAPLRPHEVGRAIALFDFSAVESGDLSFRKGQVISILQKSNKKDDWWKGVVDGREGIFPANFVEVV